MRSSCNRYDRLRRQAQQEIQVVRELQSICRSRSLTWPLHILHPAIKFVLTTSLIDKPLPRASIAALQTLLEQGQILLKNEPQFLRLA